MSWPRRLSVLRLNVGGDGEFHDLVVVECEAFPALPACGVVCDLRRLECEDKRLGQRVGLGCRDRGRGRGGRLRRRGDGLRLRRVVRIVFGVRAFELAWLLRVQEHDFPLDALAVALLRLALADLDLYARARSEEHTSEL